MYDDIFKSDEPAHLAAQCEEKKDDHIDDVAEDSISRNAMLVPFPVCDDLSWSASGCVHAKPNASCGLSSHFMCVFWEAHMYSSGRSLAVPLPSGSKVFSSEGSDGMLMSDPDEMSDPVPAQDASLGLGDFR
jgi:hypothetical protein